MVLLLLAAIIIPAVSSAGNTAPGHTGIVLTPAVINVTNSTLPDPSELPEYQPGAEPVKIQAELNASQLPVSKGEMAGGPRSIGGNFDPAIIIAAIVVIAGIALCAAWYIRRGRTSENQDDDPSEEK